MTDLIALGINIVVISTSEYTSPSVFFLYNVL